MQSSVSVSLRVVHIRDFLGHRGSMKLAGVDQVNRTNHYQKGGKGGGFACEFSLNTLKQLVAFIRLD